MSAKRLLQMSGVVVDLIYRVDAIPPVGGEAAAHDCTITPGGGFNAMVAATRAGMEVAYGGAHGDRPVRRHGQARTQKVRCSLSPTSVRPMRPGKLRRTGRRQGERTFIFKEGADGVLNDDRLSPGQFLRIRLDIAIGVWLAHTGSRDALRAKLFELPPGSAFVLDPSPAVSLIPPELLQHAFFCARWTSANADEAAVITGQDQPAAAANALVSRMSGHAGGAVVRCGSAGCWVATRDTEPVLVPGFAVETVDTNGAGDTHVATFIAALSNGADPMEAARYANAAAALSTTRHGPATAPEDDETRRFMNNETAPDETSFMVREYVQEG